MKYGTANAISWFISIQKHNGRSRHFLYNDLYLYEGPYAGYITELLKAGVILELDDSYIATDVGLSLLQLNEL